MTITEELESKKQVMLLEEELKEKAKEVQTLSEALQEYKQGMESKNARIIGLESRLQQLEGETKGLKVQLESKKTPLVINRTTIFSKIGNIFLIFTIVLLFLHYTGFINIPQVFSQFDSVLRRTIALPGNGFR